MAQTRDIQSAVEAAEQAAADGDYESAEQFLRDAARLQESHLGPLHPDLANTLNNLAIVCEITKKPEAAEQFFRRAHAIAAESLPADHPFVETSRKNLEDFCRAQGKPMEPPPEPPSPPPRLEQVATELPPVAPRAAPTDAASPSRMSPMLWIAVGVIAILVIVYLAFSLRSTREGVPAPTNVVTTPSAPQATPSPTGEPKAVPATPDPTVAPRATKPPSPKPPLDPGRRDSKADVASSLTIVDARLCQTLATGAGWRCVAPEQPARPGPMYFYNRLKSSTDTTVEHRWYRGDRLVRVAELRIRANPSEGYRTFTRNTVNAQNAGEWRVELRAKDGTVLREERFTVR
jgi:hypothetical protein